MAVRRKGLGRGLDGLIPNYKSEKQEKPAEKVSKPAKTDKNVKKAKTSKPSKAEKTDKTVETIKEDVIETSANVSRETLAEEIIGTENPSVEETETIVEAAEKLVEAFDLADADITAGAAVLDAAPNAEKSVVDATASAAKEGGPVYLKISEVEPNKDQPRHRFDEDALTELSESIKQYGVISPLIVKQRDGYYEIVAGERRWRAAKMAGLKSVPVIIRDLSDKEIMEISLIENIQREDLNPIEEAEAFQKLLSDFDMTQDELATRVSRSRTAITNAIRLLKLDKRVQEMLIEEMISSGHARALLGIADGDMQKEAADKIFDEHLSVRETEKLVKLLTGEKKQKKEPQKPDASLAYIYQDMEEKMKEILGTKVVVNRKSDNKGKIEIEYYSGEELERIFDLLGQLRR